MRDVYCRSSSVGSAVPDPMKYCVRNQRLQTTQTPGCQHHPQRVQVSPAVLGIVLDERVQHLRHQVSCISRISRPDIARFANG